MQESWDLNPCLRDFELTRWSLNLASAVNLGWGRALGMDKGTEATLRCELGVPGRDGRRDTWTWKWRSLDISGDLRRPVLPEKWLWGPFGYHQVCCLPHIPRFT